MNTHVYASTYTIMPRHHHVVLVNFIIINLDNKTCNFDEHMKKLIPIPSYIMKSITPPPHFFLNTVCMFPVNGMTFRSMHSSQTHPIHLLFKTTLSFVMLMPENGISGLQWLQKQAKARQVADLQDSDLTEEERNPLFLRDKGKYVVLLFFCVPLLFFYRGGTLVLG